MTTQFEQIIYDVEDRVLTITLNRPDRLNAFTGTMQNELIDAFTRADNDDEVRVIIMTGAGRGFCAGADLSGGETTFDRARRGETVGITNRRDGGGKVSLAIYDMRKPLIAAVNGPAVGVGVTMTLPMDIRLASEKARFGFVFTRRGIVPEACSSWFLPRIVGISQAAEWMLTGRVFSAQEALERRLVSQVLPPDELLPRAREIALEIAQNTSAVSVALTRQMIYKALGADHPMEAHKIESKGIVHMGAAEDIKEGINSFMEKRLPDFPMKASTDMPDYYPWWEERTFS